MTTIKKADVNDVDIIVPLFDAYRCWYQQPTDVETARIFITERLQKNESVIFIAFNNGIPAGFTQLYPVFSSVGMKRAWVLNDLFVHPDHRKKQIGTGLLEAAKQMAKATDSRYLVLETEPNNLAAQALYEGNGWEKESHFFYTYSIK